jgi:hypothetical protein
MSKDRTHFDEEGRIVGLVSPRPAAFIVDFAGVCDRPAFPSPLLNGQEFYVKRSADAICLEIWNGTRLATDSSHVFLVVYELASGGAEIPPVSVADEQRKKDTSQPGRSSRRSPRCTGAPPSWRSAGARRSRWRVWRR